jgi:hydroxymethylglutaryl-CoA lyase
LDCGSFVSPKAIPQLRDTAEVISKLDLSQTTTKLLTIIANLRGAEQAVEFDQITYLGYPFSISETFQLRNTNATIVESLTRVEEIQRVCVKNKKELVVYISMAFGNPYGDPWSAEVAMQWAKKLVDLGIQTLSFADTTGVSNPENIRYLFSNLIPEFPDIRIGAHLHTTPETALEKLEAAWQAGCRRFDHAINGFGGCPMADDELTGNIATEQVLSFLKSQDIETSLNESAFLNAAQKAMTVFPAH